MNRCQRPRPWYPLVHATPGGVFKDTYNVLNGAYNIIPVDVFVLLAARPNPEAIIDGVVQALGVLKAKMGLGPEPVPTFMPGDEDGTRHDAAGGVRAGRRPRKATAKRGLTRKGGAMF